MTYFLIWLCGFLFAFGHMWYIISRSYIHSSQKSDIEYFVTALLLLAGAMVWPAMYPIAFVMWIAELIAKRGR
jgi:hypothetical protein